MADFAPNPDVVDAAIAQRDQHADVGDLTAALAADDHLENLGVHPDERRTCFRCQDWADDDHAHDPLTGALITPAAD